MPARSGESHLTTLFADVHCYLNAPNSKPQHHRFDRGSYVYLFNDAASIRARVEVANHAGTPEQDAWSGSLDVARLSYSYKQPNLVTLNIDRSAVTGHEEWHLPAYDEQNEQKYLYRIFSVDIYLWTEKDAATLLSHLEAIMPIEKQAISDAPAHLQKPAEHRDSMSPTVQQLERTAIGAQFPPRAESTVSAHSMPGPSSHSTLAGAIASSQPTPLAYNPAAPAAPEPIAHREKTPPPLDAETGTGLTQAAKYDVVPPQSYGKVPNTFQSSNQTTPQQAYLSGPPQQAQSPFPGAPSPYSAALPSPPPPPGVPSFAPPPGSQTASPAPMQPQYQRQTSFGGPPGATQQATYSSSTPSFGPSALASPGLPPTSGYGSQQQQNLQQPPTPSAPPAYSQYSGHPHHQSEHQQTHQQIFGYSDYSYSAPRSVDQGFTGSYGYAGDMHNQLYRPTAAEAAHAHRPPTPPTQRRDSEARGKLEAKVDMYEKKMGGLFKKLDKMW